MASLTAVGLKTSAWLKLVPLMKNWVIHKSCTVASCQVFHNFHTSNFTLGQSLSVQKTSRMLHSGHCQCLRKQHWSSMIQNVRQIDLEAQKPTEKPELKVNASEVLQNLNPEEARKLKIIKLEFDVVEQMYGKVPQEMTDENWLHALQLDSKSKRMRYYNFLLKVERVKRTKQRKQEEKQQERAEAQAEREEPVEKNTIFFTIRDSALKRAGHYRLAHAMQFGQPLVFDFDYEQHMRHQDCQNLINQVLISYSKNRDSLDPYHFIFTSVDPRGKVLQMLQRAKMTGLNFMGTMTDKSYLDLFPRERLVYLSPHANESLKEVNADDVYIIGGIVDKINTKPLSLARAKEQRIRVAKFPLDKYLLWGMGSKSLTLDQVTAIMLEQRRSKDWNEAFKAIPMRKLYREDN